MAGPPTLPPTCKGELNVEHPKQKRRNLGDYWWPGNYSVKLKANRVHDGCSFLHASVIIQGWKRYIYASNPDSMPDKNQLCDRLVIEFLNE